MKKARLHFYATLIFFSALAGQDAYAASPYDAYYKDYGQPDPEATPAAPVDNDAYYTAPGTYTDNDAYYAPPGSYQTEQQGSGYSVNCNTIGDMASCAGD